MADHGDRAPRLGVAGDTGIMSVPVTFEEDSEPCYFP